MEEKARAKVRQGIDKARYLDTTPSTASATWSLMGTGVKTAGDTPAAQTKSRKYINNKSASKSITGYDWSAPIDMDQVSDEAAVEYVYNIGHRELTGADAETNYLEVDLDKPVSGAEGTYEARKRRVAVEVADMPEEDGELGITGNLLGIGDPVFGKFNVATKTFTAEGEVVS